VPPRGDCRPDDGAGVGATDDDAFAAREFRFTRRDFDTLRELVYATTGIALAEHKQDMVYNRLARRLRSLGLDSFSAYLDRLRGGDDAAEAEMAILTNAITTNLTRFFREAHHFEHLRETAIPDSLARMRRGDQRRLRVWSAGCSSGEEPYSIAITLAETGGLAAGFDSRILATDLDTDMLARGVAGVYPTEGLDGLPDELRQRHSSATETADGRPAVRMAETLRRAITFKQLNLMHDWPMQGPFDAIFCRNVMIYFDAQTRTWLVERFFDYLRPGGWLYTGHAESGVVTQSNLVAEGRTIYRRVT